MCAIIHFVAKSTHGGLAQLGEHLPYKQRVTGSSPVVPTNKKERLSTKTNVLFLKRCVPQAERDAHFVRDVCFASNVRFAREYAEHITSLCAKGARHHYGEAITLRPHCRRFTW